MSKFTKKWIADNAVDGDKIRLFNDQFLRARNQADTADLTILKANANDKAEFGVEPIYGGLPSLPQSLVNKSWVLDALAGLRDLKDAARVGTQINIALTGGATLTIDGVSLDNGDRVILLGQADATQNGIYTVSGIGSAYVLARSSDANSNDEVTQGMSVDIVEGLVLGRTRWLLTTANPDLGTSNLVFVKVPASNTIVQFKTEKFTISNTNGFVDLAHNAEAGSIVVYPVGGPVQESDVDYTISVVGGVTRVTFGGSLATLIELNDVLVVKYAHY